MDVPVRHTSEGGSHTCYSRPYAPASSSVSSQQAVSTAHHPQPRACRPSLLDHLPAASRVMIGHTISELSLMQYSAEMQVDWSGMHEPSAADAVALIMPPHADLQTAVPLKYKWANKSPDHVKTGRGSLEYAPLLLCPAS